MKEFFDTSVLVAAFWGGHVHHLPSLKAFAAAEKKRSACGLHTLAELYAVMTALPIRPVIPPEQALLFVEEVRTRLSLVTLSPEENSSAIRGAAERGHSGGRVYDALLLACATKWESQRIYTWNLKHYRFIAPDLAAKIQSPQ
jgi:predicted nucleic acid-binding protein